MMNYISPRVGLLGLLAVLVLCPGHEGSAVADSPWPILVQVEDVAAKRTEKAGEVAAPAEGKEVPRSLTDLSMEVVLRTSPERGACRMTVVLRDLSGRDREVAIHFVLPASHGFTHVLHPNGLKPRECKGAWTEEYRSRSVLPLASFYTPGASGLTLCADFDQMIPALLFRCDADGQGGHVSAVFANRCLPAKGSAEVTLYAVLHEGDWRPGMGWALDRFPDYFRPGGKVVYEYEGGMIYDFLTPEERIVRDKDLNLQWQEVGWAWPHLGLYVPEADTWQRQPRSDGGLGEGGTVTRQMIHDYLALLRRRHVGSFMYFQSTESWQKYAERRFPESIVRKPDGELCPTWIKCVVMNPRPDGPFGRHILEQVDAMLRVFPEIDGLFWDQNCYGGNDFGQQDEFTMVNGRRCSNMEIGQRRLLDIAGPRLHAAGKAIWSNGPCSIGVARQIDGAMSEGTAGARRMSWICVAKPLIILSYDANPSANEQKLMIALECGGQPAVTLGPKACREIEARYQDMLKLLLRREVVLSPYAYEPPAGFGGNIFRRPEGNLVVTLVRESGAVTPPMVELAARPAKGTDVRAVYELTADSKGLRRCVFTTKDGVIRWSAVSPQEASLFVLATHGRFLSTPQRAVIRNSQSKVRACLENLTEEPWTAEVLIAGGPKLSTVPPMERVDVAGEVAPCPQDGSIKLELTGKPDGVVGPQTIGIPVLPAVGVWAGPDQPDEFAGSTARVVFGVLNHAEEEVQPAVQVEAQGGKAVATAPRLRPGEASEVAVAVEGLAPGSHRIALQVSTLGTQSRAERIIRVTRADFPSAAALRTARSLTVTMDVFNSLGGPWADKPVRVNGVEIGKLPVTGSTLQWHKGLSLIAKDTVLRGIADKAIEADGSSATFRVTIDNGVRNCFKVRRCRLAFQLPDGTITASAPDESVHCSDANWLYTEGKGVKPGERVDAATFRFPFGSADR